MSVVQEVNDRLETATNERSEYRQYLLEAQQELQQTRDELLEWSEGLQVRLPLPGFRSDALPSVRRLCIARILLCICILATVLRPNSECQAVGTLCVCETSRLGSILPASASDGAFG